jgi:hypothetical protein
VDTSGSGYFVVKWWLLNIKPLWLGEGKGKMFPKLLKHKCINKKGNPERHYRKILELVQVLDLRRRRANIILGEAKFAAVCGRYGENFNEA